MNLNGSGHHNRRKIVHIIGCGHSGSTLLDMILGGHTQVSSLGEVYFLHFYLRNFREKDLCTCGKHVMECPFWIRVEAEAQKVLHTNKRPVLLTLQLADERTEELMNERGEFRYRMEGESNAFRSRINEATLVLGSRLMQRVIGTFSKEVRYHQHIARDTITLYDLVRRAHGTPIIVDSTKNPGTFKNVYLQAYTPMYFLLLLRDGRGVCCSRMRREAVTMAQAAPIWKHEHRKRRAALFRIPRDRIFSVHYEALASEPERTVRAICDFLSIDYEPAMLDYRKSRHNLGGNPMRYRQSAQTIRLDEAWRTLLTEDDLLTFDKVAGALNEQLGYSRSK